MKEIDDFQKQIKKITSFPNNVSAKLNNMGIKSPVGNPVKNISKYVNEKNMFSHGINAFENISSFTKAAYKNIDVINQIVKPYLFKTVTTGLAIYKVFDKEMYNEYKFKQKINEKWNKLELEIRTKYRYFPKSDLLDIFEKCAKEAKFNLGIDKVLYRARKININNLPNKIKNIIDKATKDFNAYEYQKHSDKEKDIWDYINNIQKDIWEQDYISKYKLQGNQFWGFSGKESDAPLNNDNVQGRVNPLGIVYLYTANNPITAVSEIQPTIGQLVSVAEIKPTRTLKLFNFDFNYTYKNSDFLENTPDKIKKEIGMSIYQIKIFLDTIAENFSKPSLDHHNNYYATQYLSEYIKNLGFDGLVFKSSLMKRGKNIVLFDVTKKRGKPVNYEIISSSLYKVDNIKISNKKILPKEITK